MNNLTSSSSRTTNPGEAARRLSVTVTLICWGMVTLEGYDLISFGGVLPVLIKTPGSGFTAANAGVVGAVTFAGATIGALSSGWLSDRFGRRPVSIACLLWFSVFTAFCGFADGPWWLGALRFLAGVGIGGIVPASSALTLEYAVSRHRTLFYALMLSGVPLGGVIAALSGLVIIPHFGWRWVFFIAIIPCILVLPFILRSLPESLVFLEQRGHTERAAAIRRRYGLDPTAAADSAAAAEQPKGAPKTSEGIFSPRYRLASLLFAGATFFGLLTWFGLGTWLPGMMLQGGYDLSSSLVFLLVLNLGAIAGSVVMAMATDKYGSKKIVIGTYLVMAAALAVMLVRLPQGPLLVMIALAGMGGHGGQILINRFVARSYHATQRAKALGWSLGAGRMGTILGPVLVGFILTVGGGAFGGFLCFVISSLAAALLITLVPRTPAFLEGEES